MFLLRAAAAAPGPRTSNLPKRSFAWLHTAHTDKDFKSKEIVKAISASFVLTWSGESYSGHCKVVDERVEVV